MRRLLALLVAAAHALALKTQGLGGGRLALIDFSGAMRGLGKRGTRSQAIQASPRRSAGDPRAGTGLRRVDGAKDESTRLLLDPPPEEGSQEWYDDNWWDFAIDASLVELRKLAVPGSDEFVWKAVSSTAPGYNGPDINSRRLNREWSTEEMCIDDARASYLTHCSRYILETCPVARRLRRAVSQRLKPGPLPKRRTGRTAGILQGPEGAAGIRDGQLYYMKSGRVFDQEELNKYIASCGRDKDIVEDYVETCAALEGGDLVLLRLKCMKEETVKLAAEVADWRTERFQVQKDKLAAVEQGLACKLGFDGDCLPYKVEERGENSWLGSPDFPGDGSGRAALAEFRRSDRGAAGRGALTNKRKSDIRNALYDGATPSRQVFFATPNIVLAAGVLHKFIKFKFPSIDFDEDEELLEEYVSCVELDHLISSGADFDENLWYGAASDKLMCVRAGSPNARFHAGAR